ncbi:hypothetical protein MMC21_005993 [Puttea exsequens]|nr:hypothetical protein [Puttea exsequens]
MSPLIPAISVIAQGVKGSKASKNVLEYLCHGYGKSSILMHLINTRVVLQEEKTIIFVQLPYTQFGLERILASLQIIIFSIHGGLFKKWRRQAVRLFNATPYRYILIMSYLVSRLGIDAHHQCRNVVLFEPAESTTIEMQAWFTIRRIGQE